MTSRAIFSAFSFASAPPSVKNTLPRRSRGPAIASRRSRELDLRREHRVRRRQAQLVGLALDRLDDARALPWPALTW